MPLSMIRVNLCSDNAARSLKPFQLLLWNSTVQNSPPACISFCRYPATCIMVSDRTGHMHCVSIAMIAMCVIRMSYLVRSDVIWCSLHYCMWSHVENVLFTCQVDVVQCQQSSRATSEIYSACDATTCSIPLVNRLVTPLADQALLHG